jgi:hypothetical protein
MGSLTLTQLSAAGRGRAGNLSDAVKARVEIEFQAWLDRQYAGWSWPFLKKRATGLSLTAGATSLTVGAGNGGVTREIIKLVSPVIFYTSDRTTKGKAHIIQSSGDNSLTYDETLADSATFRGAPEMFKARHGSVRGSWDLVPMPFPDKALLLALDYYELPASLGSSTIPIYPSDQTLITAFEALTLRDQKGVASPEYQAAADSLNGLIAYDRSTYGSAPGENDFLPLDSSRFK